ncbi:TPA: hypothetical protein ACHJ26_001168 [Escherichia coli]|nr:hypothetical protein [Escherichia coli]EHX1936857.1 hypothetical protein [Escherichia coli]
MNDAEPLKKCCTCGALLPISYFHNDKGKKDGKSCRCKECAKKATREWSEANKERKMIANTQKQIKPKSKGRNIENHKNVRMLRLNQEKNGMRKTLRNYAQRLWPTTLSAMAN